MVKDAKPPFWMAAGWRLIGVVFLFIILWRVGIEELPGMFLAADPVWLFAAALLSTSVLLLRSLRWRVLCSGLDIDLSWREATRLYLLGSFVAAITPGRVGDLVKAYYVRDRRAEGGLTAGIATVVYDRLLDLGQISALALGAVVAVPRVPDGVGPLLVALGVSGFVIGTVWRPTREGLMARPLNWALRRLPGADGVAPPPPPAGNVMVAQALTTASLVGFVAVNVALAKGLSIELSVWPLAVLSAAGALVGLLPITVLGIGTRDALYVAAAPFLGVTPEAMLGLSLLLLSMYVLNSVTGWTAWFLSPPRDRRPPTLS